MKNRSFTTEYLTIEVTKTGTYQCFIDMRLLLPPQDVFYLFNSKIWSAYYDAFAPHLIQDNYWCAPHATEHASQLEFYQ